jgi:hypothetical protein
MSTQPERGPSRLFDVDALADEIGAARRPEHERWVRDMKHPEGGYFTPVSAGNGERSTMETFTAEDGYPSMRSLTWREVVQIVHDALVEKGS